MAKIKLQGNANGSGVFTLTSPNSDTDRTITLPDADVTLGTDATKLPLAGGTLTGDLILGDNVKLEIGSASGGDLQIFHDASHSYISDQGTGNLRVLASNFEVKNAANNEDMIGALADGSVKLYHNNAKKLETTATGIAVTGGVAIGGTGTANTLEDYEEGTWTPVYTVTGGGSHSSVSAGNAGTYTKVGRIVTISIYSYIVSTSGTITGYNVSLPFAAGNYPSSGMGIEFGHSGHGQKLQVNHNSSTMNITKYDGTSPMGSAYFHIGITYHAA